MYKLIKIFFIVFGVAVVLLAAALCYFFIGKAEVKDSITWGIDFSQSQAEYL